MARPPRPHYELRRVLSDDRLGPPRIISLESDRRGFFRRAAAITASAAAAACSGKNCFAPTSFSDTTSAQFLSPATSRYIAETSGITTIKVWDTETRQLVGRIADQGSLVASQDCAMAVVRVQGDRLRTWDIGQMRLVEDIAPPTDNSSLLHLFPGASEVYAVTFSQPSSGQVEFVVDRLPGLVRQAAFTARISVLDLVGPFPGVLKVDLSVDASSLLVSTASSVVRYDTATGAALSTGPHPGPGPFVTSDDGMTAVVGTTVYDFSKPTASQLFDAGQNYIQATVSLSADGASILFADTLFDRKGNVLRTLPNGPSVLSADGTQLVVVQQVTSGHIEVGFDAHLFDAASGSDLGTLIDRKQVACSDPDGNVICTCVPVYS